MCSGVPPACLDKMRPWIWGHHWQHVFFPISFSPWQTGNYYLGSPTWNTFQPSIVRDGLVLACPNYIIKRLINRSLPSSSWSPELFHLLPSDFCQGHNLSKGAQRSKSGTNGIKPVPRLEGLRKKLSQSNCSALWILPYPPYRTRILSLLNSCT